MPLGAPRVLGDLLEKQNKYKIIGAQSQAPSCPLEQVFNNPDTLANFCSLRLNIMLHIIKTAADTFGSKINIDPLVLSKIKMIDTNDDQASVLASMDLLIVDDSWASHWCAAFEAGPGAGDMAARLCELMNIDKSFLEQLVMAPDTGEDRDMKDAENAEADEANEDDEGNDDDEDEGDDDKHVYTWNEVSNFMSPTHVMLSDTPEAKLLGLEVGITDIKILQNELENFMFGQFLYGMQGKAGDAVVFDVSDS